MRNNKIFLLSLGCDKNTVDAELLLSNFIHNGFEVTKDLTQADLIIVNTCAFIESARVESIEAIFDSINNKKPNAKVIVTGCLSQRYKEELESEIPEIDGFFRLNETNKIMDLFNLTDHVDGDTRNLTTDNFAYLKISDGCNRNCSYCSIPLIRGKHRSRSISEIREEAQELENKGVKELILVAQDLTQYGTDLDEDISLIELLKILSDDFNFKWIRLLYLYPEGITDELLDLIDQKDNILPYFDIPIQHTSNKILKSMNRHISKEEIYKLISKIRSKFNNPIVRTTFIVGYPGETSEDFQELLNDLEQLKLDRFGCFGYSREEDTKAYNLPDQVSSKEIENRVEIFNQKSSELIRESNKKFINKTFPCLIEQIEDNNSYIGRLILDAPDIDFITYVNSNKNLEIGEIVPVKIRESLNFDYIGDFDESAK